jgi:hypothetical protein
MHQERAATDLDNANNLAQLNPPKAATQLDSKTDAVPELVQEEVEDYTSKNDANDDAKEVPEQKKNEESGDIYQVSAKNQSLIQNNAQMRRSVQNLPSNRNSRQGS